MNLFFGELLLHFHNVAKVKIIKSYFVNKQLFNINLNLISIFLSLRMILFDFHHHKSNNSYGIYNLNQEEALPEHYFSIGIHPKNIDKNWPKHFEKIKEISLQKNCVAIGECGLDALIDVNEDLQKKIFEAQILWANEINKPVIIHCVRRFHELVPFQKISKT